MKKKLKAYKRLLFQIVENSLNKYCSSNIHNA